MAEGQPHFGVNVGRPAEQAFLAAGYTTFEQLAAASDKELLALHGVGPKAIRILREHQSRLKGSASS
jgi:predicted flap endonuclease-1-like 5' DNA nuclease